MRAVDIIIKKRDGKELSREEIEYFLAGFVNGDIPDYQAAAWSMAVLLNGMTDSEIANLTLSMANSGELLNLSSVVSIAVDKHSTGGVGDKTTLVVLPMVAACGLPVGKMSGRGLGFSGGTLDKMESIPGYRTNLSTDEFLDQLRNVGLVLSGQTTDLAPADGKLYGLRDVTGTVQSIPLIVSSVMSKKIAAGAQAIVLDVKVGKGAFMETIEDARTLAGLMVSIAKSLDIQAVAIISDMNQPLGYAVGNTLELLEAIDVLQGGGPPDFLEHCLVVAGHMLTLGGVTKNAQMGKVLAEEVLRNGNAWLYFKDLVNAQGGEVSYITNTELLVKARYTELIQASRSGYLSEINARIVGETVVQLGGGRAKKGDQIDYAVGVVINNKVGDYIETGQSLFSIHANSEESLHHARQRIMDAHSWSVEPVEPLPLFYDVIR